MIFYYNYYTILSIITKCYLRGGIAMAQNKDLPLGVRLKKFIKQYTDSKTNAVNLFMYGIISIFIVIFIVVMIYSAKLQDAIEQLNFTSTTTEQTTEN